MLRFAGGGRDGGDIFDASSGGLMDEEGGLIDEGTSSRTISGSYGEVNQDSPRGRNARRLVAFAGYDGVSGGELSPGIGDDAKSRVVSNGNDADLRHHLCRQGVLGAGTRYPLDFRR